MLATAWAGIDVMMRPALPSLLYQATRLEDARAAVLDGRGGGWSQTAACTVAGRRRLHVRQWRRRGSGVMEATLAAVHSHRQARCVQRGRPPQTEASVSHMIVSQIGTILC